MHLLGWLSGSLFQKLLLTLQRNASSSVLERAVIAALLPTHVHPVSSLTTTLIVKEGVEGAFFQAWAVSELCKIEDATNYTKQHFVDFLKKLLQVSNVQIVKEKLQFTIDALQNTNWKFNQEEVKVSKEVQVLIFFSHLQGP